MKYFAIFIVMIYSAFSFSETSPNYAPYDERIAFVDYNSDDVIRVNISAGIATLIQLEKGESISSPDSGIGIGDIEAWGLNIKGNNIFLKPKAKKPDTNLTLVSNKGRTYSFFLNSSKNPHFIVKIVYEEDVKVSDRKHDVPCTDGGINFNWFKWGNQNLSPTYMWDDGRFTCLKFSKTNEMPVVYKIADSGEESIVYYHFESDVMVIHTVSNEFRLRLDDHVLGLSSNNVDPSGFNFKGTTVKGERGLKHVR